MITLYRYLVSYTRYQVPGTWYQVSNTPVPVQQASARANLIERQTQHQHQYSRYSRYERLPWIYDRTAYQQECRFFQQVSPCPEAKPL